MVRWLIMITAAAAVVLCSGCTSTRNTAATRNYQAFITHYNIHYNGDKHYRETLEDMERDYRDDFSRILFVHPAEARGVAGVEQPTGDFTRSIEKAQKAIQLRSIKRRPAGPSSTPAQREWKRRNEYNPFLHNSWLMLGRAEYMNGDFALAANTFLYISRHFKWLPDVVAEARIREAMCYCALDRLYEAETLLAKAARSLPEDKELRRLYLSARSSLLTRRGDYDNAAKTLGELVELSHGKQKTRLRYLLGQTLERSGDRESAYLTFKQIEGSLTTDYATRFNARMAMSAVTPASETDKEIISLKKLLRYGSNAEYLDRIYDAIGNLYLSKGDTAEALNAYTLAVEKSVRHGYDQARARLSAGSLLYDRGRYDLARECYNAALPLLPADHPGIDSIRQRAEALDEIGIYAGDVWLQDSLLALSRLAPDTQLAIARRLANEYRSESSKDEMPTPTASTYTTIQPPTGNAEWYFYNPSLVRAGRAQFRKIWGDRPLADNWRNLKPEEHTGSVADQLTGNADTDDEDITVKPNRNDPADPQYYLAAIPDTPEKKHAAEKRVEDGLYRIATLLSDRLDDYKAARRTLERLIKRFPKSDKGADAAERLFLMYSREGDSANAERVRQLILSEYSDHAIGRALAQPGYIERKKEAYMSQNALYKRVYAAYLDNDNATVHMLCDSTDSNLAPEIAMHMRFLNALAYGAEGSSGRFGEGMKELASDFPGTEIAALAAGMLRHMESGLKPGQGSNQNVRPMTRSMQPEADVSADTSDRQICTDSLFTMEADGAHVVLLLYSPDSISANMLLYDVARYNFNTFAVRDFDLQPMTIGNDTAFAVRDFSSHREAQAYITRITNAMPQIFADGSVRPVAISSDDLKALQSRRLSVGHYTHAVEAARYRDAQTSVLSAEIYEIEPIGSVE